MRVHSISNIIPQQPLSFHHELTLKPARDALEEWNDVVSQESRRCRFCWLRYYNCFCGYLNAKRNQYHEMISPFSCPTNESPSITVTIYYHYHEIGRSANTMHILEVLCPDLCKNIILGDINEETQLLQRIIQSQDDERLGKFSRRIAVLYPSPDSVTIPKWLIVGNPLTTNSELSQPSTVESIELIVLDGTYGQAARLVSPFYCLIS